MIDILIVIGVLSLGAVVFIFVQLATVLFLLKENERMHLELEKKNQNFWDTIDERNNLFK